MYKFLQVNKILIIQTAFIGDVVLATPVIEKLHQIYPQVQIDFMLRKGNEGLLEGHYLLSKVWIWDKKKDKYSKLYNLIKSIRAEKYDVVVNLQRFFSTGLVTVFSGANQTIGFKKNPLSFFFTKRYPHIIDTEKGDVHEVDRNLSLLSGFTLINERTKPALYPRPSDFEKVKHQGRYVTFSPASVWFTKQYPMEKWVEVANLINPEWNIFLLGGKTDLEKCEWIKSNSTHKNIVIKAGDLSFLESAALMKNAEMNYVNDSAPLHFASATDAPVTAIFCSTVPAFGFGPLSSRSRIVEYDKELKCRPCGLHGYKACPLGHFRCADISAEKVVSSKW